MKTTTAIVDEMMDDYLREKGYLEAERYHNEMNLMQEIYEEEMKNGEIIMGVPQENSNFEDAKINEDEKTIQHSNKSSI